MACVAPLPPASYCTSPIRLSPKMFFDEEIILSQAALNFDGFPDCDKGLLTVSGLPHFLPYQ